MEVKSLNQRQRFLQATFEMQNDSGTHLSPKYVLNGATFQVKVIILNANRFCDDHNIVFIKFRTHNTNSDYALKLSSKKFKLTNKCYKSDDSTWRQIALYKPDYVNMDISLDYSFDISIRIDTVKPEDNFIATLYEDDELTDFELSNEEGSVLVHKTILAAASPVLKRMLQGEWNEAKQGRIEISGVPKSALQHLKDYIYLRKLPETGLEQILLLASCYMMPELEQKCIDKLMTKINATNAIDLSEFAIQNKMTRLHLAILECFQNDVVKVDDVRAKIGEKRKSEPNDTAAVKKDCQNVDE